MKRSILALIFALVTLFSPGLTVGATAASGATEEFPVIEGDYSLDVVQVAEQNGALSVFVYKPCGDEKPLRASYMNMTLSTPDEYNLYALEFVQETGTLQKYVVKDFTVDATQATRKYEISTIYRPWDQSLGDAIPDDDNTVLQVPYPVGHSWTMKEDGTCDLEDIELIKIEDKHVGFLRYADGFNLFLGLTDIDSHYVAFSTDREIDELLQATLYFTHQSMTRTTVVLSDEEPTVTSGTSEPEIVDLKSTDLVERDESWLGLKEGYHYNRIQTTDALLEAEGDLMTEESKAALEGTEWVLRFYESRYTERYNEGGYYEYVGYVPSTLFETFEKVSNVTIFRLAYITDGKYYDVAALDSISEGDLNPDKPPKYPGPTIEWWVYLLIALAVLILLSYLFGGITVIVKILLLPVKLAVWLLKALGKGIGALFRRKNE